MYPSEFDPVTDRWVGRWDAQDGERFLIRVHRTADIPQRARHAAELVVNAGTEMVAGSVVTTTCCRA